MTIDQFEHAKQAKHPATLNHREVILIATDFSPSGDRAMEMGAALATLRGARACLVHVFEPPSITVPELGLDPGLELELRQRAEAQLARAANGLRARGLGVDERLAIGSPAASVIADVAAELTPSLVVLGSHGRRPLPRLLMGSVAEAALLRIQQPVVVVPQGTAAGAGALPWRAPGTDGRPWRIAVGLDQSNTSAAAVDWVRELRQRADCDVTFLHLYWPVSEYARFGLTGPRNLFEADREVVGLLENALASTIGTLPGRGEVTLRILPNWGPPGQRLVDEAVAAKADLLVLGTHHRHGFSRLLKGSTVPPALHAGSLPIVCVSPQPRPAAARRIPRLRSILAATDLSEGGNRSIGHAFALARTEGGSGGGIVHILYVHERMLPTPAYAYPPESSGSLRPDETKELRERLTALIPAEASGLGISTDVLVVDGGMAADVICQTAERLDVDAISVGSRGRGGVSNLVLGSVAARVLHEASRPVLVVRSHAG
jgi:nucleotide-binding universal stress UspA family protein